MYDPILHSQLILCHSFPWESIIILALLLLSCFLRLAFSFRRIYFSSQDVLTNPPHGHLFKYYSTCETLLWSIEFTFLFSLSLNFKVLYPYTNTVVCVSLVFHWKDTLMHWRQISHDSILCFEIFQHNLFHIVDDQDLLTSPNFIAFPHNLFYF